jgi:hypothetical protein
MKTARFLFTIVGFGALTLGLGFASEPSRQPSGQGPSEDQAASKRPVGLTQGNPVRGKAAPTEGQHSESKDDSHASEKSRQAGPIQKATPTHRPGQDRPKQVAKGYEDPAGQRVDKIQTKRPSVKDLPQPGLNKAAVGAKPGLMMKTAGNQRQQFPRLPVGSGTTAPLSGVVRGRGAAPASIGGLTVASARSTAAVISGTGMGHKP